MAFITVNSYVQMPSKQRIGFVYEWDFNASPTKDWRQDLVSFALTLFDKIEFGLSSFANFVTLTVISSLLITSYMVSLIHCVHQLGHNVFHLALKSISNI